MSQINVLRERLKNYPGAHEGETWKLETDLTRCTPREKAMMKKNGVTVEELMAAGFNRGEAAHMFFGYLHTRT